MVKDIGVTSKSPENRWCNGLGYSYNKYFYSAIKKYGWDNFKHNIIKENLSYEEAANLEREYIEKYDTINPKKVIIILLEEKVFLIIV